jgi:hypothetical protein
MGVGVFGRAWCEASKGQVQSPKKEGASHFIPCPNNFSNLTAKIWSVFYFILKSLWKKPMDSQPCLGFYSCPTQTSFERPLPWSKHTTM